MPLAAFKDLCLDATDPEHLGRFWATVLGRRIEVGDDGDVVLHGDHPNETIWVTAVPEPRTVWNRVHLDVSLGSLQPLLEAGARVLAAAEDTGRSWSVMADPEGGEFCAFVRDDLDPSEPARLFEVVVQAADSAASLALAEWWAAVFGGESVDDGRGFWWVVASSLPFATLDVVPAPDPKTVKNRVHWDVTTDDVPGLVARGATVLREPDDEIAWYVLADPQGNEFCAFAPGEADSPA